MVGSRFVSNRVSRAEQTASGPDPGDPSRRGLWIALAAGLLTLLLPVPEGLSVEGRRLAALFVTVILLWVTEALPIGITALLAVLLQPLLGIRDLKSAFQGFASPVFFFVLAMFCIAAAITSAGLERRFAYWLLDRAGTDSRRVVIALMLGSALTSTIISDVPACAIFMAIGLGVLRRLEAKPGESSFAKAVMIGIPIGSLIGGVATPAGSSINILGIHFIEEYGGVRIPFLDWMLLGVPMVVVLLPIACWVVLRVFPPEMASVGGREEVRGERAALGGMSGSEKKTIALLAAMIALWVAGSWIPALSTVVVALAGTVLMFVPGVSLLTWERAERSISWATLLMIGGVVSIGSASLDAGLARWLVDTLLGGLGSWDLVWIVAAISAFTVVIHLALPIGPVINAVLIPPIALLAQETGHNPALLALPVAFTASCSMLLPIDPVPLITYAKGYYRMFDMAKVGTIISVFWVIWMTVLMLLVAPLIGIA